MHLRHLVGQHVAIVIVACHAESAARPTDDLHRRGVTDEVLQIAPRAIQKALREEFFLVLRVKDLFHLLPEAFLPFEDGLLGHDVRNDIGLEAAREEDVCQVLNVVQGVVVDHDCCFLILELAAVDDNGRILNVLRKERGEHAALAHALPPRTILATDGMPLEEHGLIETQLDAWNVDRVPGDGYAVPTAAHRPVRRAPRLPEAEGLHLIGRGRDGGLLEDRADAGAALDGIMKHLVLRVVAALAAKVEKLPPGGVNERLDPLFTNQLHGIPRHLLAADVSHRRRDDLPRGERSSP
mmetsp:Transcript_94361/g.185027  ORF Transcript_94361/g.185027 Transcript_94361/m.185027 type:complete len:296 (+) Transcript_94361:676-1563(+)